jgi:hypothetical protein
MSGFLLVPIFKWSVLGWSLYADVHCIEFCQCLTAITKLIPKLLFSNDDRLAALSALMPPFFSDISPYNYEVLQTVVAKWRQFCESSIPECIEPESQQERTIAAGLLQLERTENILNFLVHYKVRFS